MDESEKPQNLWCLSRDFRALDAFRLYELEATDQRTAWEEIEDTIETSMSQDWVLTAKEIQTLRDLLVGV